MKPNTEFSRFTPGDLHIILYAKGWYVETNTMDDLRKLIAAHCMLPVESVSDRDLVGLVADTMHRVLATYNSMTAGDAQILYKEVWCGGGIFDKDKTSITMGDMVESFLRVIRQKTIKHYPELPEPESKYLPIEEGKLEYFRELGTKRAEYLKTID